MNGEMIGWTVQVVSDFSPHEEKDAMLAQFSSKPNGGKLLPFGYCAHSIFIRTVKLYVLLSPLLNWFKLVYGLFGESIIHCTLNAQTSQEKIECTKGQ